MNRGVVINTKVEEQNDALGLRTKLLIKKYGFSFKKSFGQNFLIDSHVLQKLVGAGEITKEDYVIEIGPGIGVLTNELCKLAARVTGIEIDKKLVPLLTESLREHENFELISEDVLKLDLREMIAERGYKSAKVVANLPYYITTPIIMGLLESKVPLTNITVMVQKEVAERMRAVPGTKDYGSLSLAVQYRAEAYLVANVPENCFMPRPNVASAVIRLTPRPVPAVDVCDESLFFEIIKAAFAMRRKTLVNCLHSSGLFDCGKEELIKLLESCGLDEKVRGETLGLSEFAKITNAVLSN